jgi:hypothetical protein
MMKKEFSYRLSSIPLDEDWMTAELYYGDLHFGDLVEWGEKIIFCGGYHHIYLEFPVDEFRDFILRAKNEVRFIEKKDGDGGSGLRNKKF